MLNLVKRLKKRRKKIKLGIFHCSIGDVEAEIFPISTYEQEREYSRDLENRYKGISPWFKKFKLSKKEAIAITFLHNFKGEHSVSCSKMNLEKRDNGDMYCTVTDAPGTCLAMPQREVGEYSHKKCPYLP